jgi:hypothetical protein
MKPDRPQIGLAQQRGEGPVDVAGVSDPSGVAFALIDPTDRVDAPTDVAAGSARVDDPYDD